MLCAVTVAACAGEDQREPAVDEGAEESGRMLALGDVYDQVRNGARLTMSFDPTEHFFVGSVRNTTDQTLCRVRVEVHLSNGMELGPTVPSDLPPGEELVVELTAPDETFDGWNTHPETSSCSGEGPGEHEEDSGEHGEESGEHGS
jgi:hypothetical protein